MSAKTVTGVVTHVESKGHTYYGNPIKIIEIRDDSAPVGHGYSSYRISDNASMVYEIGNPEYRESAHTFALTRAGRISHIVVDKCEVCGAHKTATHDLYCPRAN